MIYTIFTSLKERNQKNKDCMKKKKKSLDLCALLESLILASWINLHLTSYLSRVDKFPGVRFKSQRWASFFFGYENAEKCKYHKSKSFLQTSSPLCINVKCAQETLPSL